MKHIILNKKKFLNAIDQLIGIDNKLNTVVKNYGFPPFLERPNGFSSMIQIILEQQVSLASAKAAFLKLQMLCSPLTPDNFLCITERNLNQIGFSRQKIVYCRNLANALITDKIKIESFQDWDDSEIRTELIKLHGIGHWTIDIYLLLVLKRPDVFPFADLAALKAIQLLYNIDPKKDTHNLFVITEKWKPWRSAATRVLWHFYLNYNK